MSDFVPDSRAVSIIQAIYRMLLNSHRYSTRNGYTGSRV